MCVRHVNRALSGVQGVSVKDVNVGSATLEYDPAEVSEQRIRDAVKEAGYESRLVA